MMVRNSEREKGCYYLLLVTPHAFLASSILRQMNTSICNLIAVVLFYADRKAKKNYFKIFRSFNIALGSLSEDFFGS